MTVAITTAPVTPAAAATGVCAPDKFGLGYESLLDAAFEDVAGASLRGRDHALDIPFLTRARDGWLDGFGMRYRYRRFEFEGIEGRNRDLHELAFPLAVAGRTDRWAFGGCFAPAVATSSNVLKDLGSRGSRDDLRLRLGLTLRRELADGAVWTVGLRRDDRFGSGKLYPSFAWEPATAQRWRVRLGLPDSAFSFRAGERHELGAELGPAGNRWHVVTDDFADEFAYEVRAGQLETYWTYGVLPRLALRLSAGYRFARHHRFVDDRGVAVSSGAEDAAYLGIYFTAGGKTGAED